MEEVIFNKQNVKRVFSLALVMALILAMLPGMAVTADAASVDDCLFDWEYYYNKYPDLQKAFGKNQTKLRNHYNTYGKKEGRCPSDVFDPVFYLNKYSDLKAAFGNDYKAAYNHFVNNGIREGRQASASFFIEVYKSNYADLRNAFGTAASDNWEYIRHWAQYGRKEGRNATSKIGNNGSTENVNDTAGMTDVTAYFAGKTIMLQSVQNGKYLCADGDVSNTPAMCNRGSGSSWETFTVSSITSDGWVGFKATTNGKYLSATINATDSPVRATASKLQSWECFRIYQKGSDFYIKAQANNKWLCVRVDKDGAPVQAYASVASTWERFTICFSGQEQYVSAAELIGTATANGISAQSDAYIALLSINSKYASQLNRTDEKGTMVFMFEGAGSNASASKRMNAMCLVVKNGDIVYLNRNCSTIPDYPFNPAKNGGDDMPTIRSGIYSFTTVNHRGKYAALNVTNASVVRFSSKSSFYSSTSYAINVHRRDSNDIAPASKSWVNSAGCLLVGQSGTSSSGEYAKFIQAVGIVASGASGSSTYKYSVTGKIVVDRTYAYSYLSNVGYSDSAIKTLG